MLDEMRAKYILNSVFLQTRIRHEVLWLRINHLTGSDKIGQISINPVPTKSDFACFSHQMLLKAFLFDKIIHINNAYFDFLTKIYAVKQAHQEILRELPTTNWQHSDELSATFFVGNNFDSQL